jgi:hypothetical protein
VARVVVDLVALGLELPLEQEAEDGGVGRALLRLSLDGALVLGRVVEADRRVAGDGMRDGGILLDPVEQSSRWS